jgi:hypothetical protein
MDTTNNNQQGQGNTPPAAGKVKTFRYRCVRDCVLEGTFRRTGDIIVRAEKKDVPHFEFIEGENS